MRSGIARKLFVLSISARAYARLAKPVWQLVVIDGYADVDLQADEIVQVPVKGGQFDSEAVVAVASRATPEDWLIYGSGFEKHPELLDELTQHVQVLGNSAETVALCAAPPRLKNTLDKIGVRCPEIQCTPPDSPEGWLCKRSGCSGGAHVRVAGQESDEPGQYWQRHISGNTYSVLFYAAEGAVKMLGTAHLLPPDKATGTYVWTGAVAPVSLDASVEEELQAMVQALARELGLIGMCGLDFIIDENNSVHLIDINPRLTATCLLHQGRFVSNLLEKHAEVCRNGSIEDLELEKNTTDGAVYGLRVVYTPDPVFITPAMVWPYFCTDLPDEGSILEPGEPVCTVHSRADDKAAVVADLEQKHEEALERLITAFDLQ